MIRTLMVMGVALLVQRAEARMLPIWSTPAPLTDSIGNPLLGVMEITPFALDRTYDVADAQFVAVMPEGNLLTGTFLWRLFSDAGGNPDGVLAEGLITDPFTSFNSNAGGRDYESVLVSFGSVVLGPGQYWFGITARVAPVEPRIAIAEYCPVNPCSDGTGPSVTASRFFFVPFPDGSQNTLALFGAPVATRSHLARCWW
ncbi:MAG: hypothetical protein U0Q16_08630 [Bryobacteraceae bacterium]